MDAKVATTIAAGLSFSYYSVEIVEVVISEVVSEAVDVIITTAAYGSSYSYSAVVETDSAKIKWAVAKVVKKLPEQQLLSYAKKHRSIAKIQLLCDTLLFHFLFFFIALIAIKVNFIYRILINN